MPSVQAREFSTLFPIKVEREKDTVFQRYVASFGKRDRGGIELGTTDNLVPGIDRTLRVENLKR